MRYTKQDILNLIEEEDVEFIRLQFTDIFGAMKNVAITISQLEKALNNQCTFDGSAIDGYLRLAETDMYLHPDLDSFAIFPWRPQQGKVARFICDVYTADGRPFEGDSRQVLKKVTDEAHKMGYKFNVGPELEFFLFHTDDNGNPTTITHEQAGYFDIGPIDLGENARRDIVLNLEDMGFEIETSHHEASPAQHEIDFKYSDALTTADNVMTFKMAVKSIAKRHGLYATFMPKPRKDGAGSGMHINMSLIKNGKNIFDSPEGKLGLSDEAYYFMAGIIKHIKGMAILTNPIVNSYKRLTPEYEAPMYVAWSDVSRMPLLRVAPFRGEGTRIELRSPDTACNPYLVLAACLEAGLDGIKNKYKCPEKFDGNFGAMTKEEIENMGIASLPMNLMEAVCEFKKDTFLHKLLGGHITEKMIEAKTSEWNKYMSQVTSWELEQYLYKF